MNQSNEPSIDEAASPIIDDITINENDPEVKVNAYVTSSTRETGLKSKRFERFSDWLKLQRAVACLVAKIRNRKTSKDVQSLDDGRTESAKIAIIKAVQNEVFADDISVLKRENKETESRDQLKEQRRTLRKSNLAGLDPFLDQDGVLRVGGRLNRSSLTFEEKHPILLPKKHHVSQLIIRHYHEKVIHHQGRQITHGAVRQAGFWVINGHKEVSRMINVCVTCKKQRTDTRATHGQPSCRSNGGPSTFYQRWSGRFWSVADSSQEAQRKRYKCQTMGFSVYLSQ
jgi:hypothetical protein